MSKWQFEEKPDGARGAAGPPQAVDPDADLAAALMDGGDGEAAVAPDRDLVAAVAEARATFVALADGRRADAAAMLAVAERLARVERALTHTGF
jgi:hypothetical protein